MDLLAAVDGLVARKDALDERLSRLATDARLWPTVAKLRAFRGVDTLTALAVHLELGCRGSVPLCCRLRFAVAHQADSLGARDASPVGQRSKPEVA